MRMRLRCPRLRVTLSVGVAVAILLASAPVGASTSHPAANVAPVPNYEEASACRDQTLSAWVLNDPCLALSLAALNNARAREGVGPMSLPGNWNSLSQPEQLFVVFNLERVDRGLPPYLGLNAHLDAAAQAAAAASGDPSSSDGYPTGGWAGVWTEGQHNAVDALYGFMYADGWGGAGSTINMDCTRATAPGCWGHRDAVLGVDTGVHCTTCEVGVGYSTGAAVSAAAVISSTVGRAPAMVFTWSSELPFLATPWLPSTANVPVAAATIVHPTLRAGQVTFHATALTTRTVTVTWSAPRAWGVGGVQVMVERGAGCSGRLVSNGSFVYPAGDNVRAGTLRVVGSFSSVEAYSGRIMLSYVNGHVTSGCVTLGRG